MQYISVPIYVYIWFYMQSGDLVSFDFQELLLISDFHPTLLRLC